MPTSRSLTASVVALSILSGLGLVSALTPDPGAASVVLEAGSDRPIADVVVQDDAASIAVRGAPS